MSSPPPPRTWASGATRATGPRPPPTRYIPSVLPTAPPPVVRRLPDRPDAGTWHFKDLHRTASPVESDRSESPVNEVSRPLRTSSMATLTGKC